MDYIYNENRFDVPPPQIILSNCNITKFKLITFMIASNIFLGLVAYAVWQSCRYKRYVDDDWLSLQEEGNFASDVNGKKNNIKDSIHYLV